MVISRCCLCGRTSGGQVKVEGDKYSDTYCFLCNFVSYALRENIYDLNDPKKSDILKIQYMEDGRYNWQLSVGQEYNFPIADEERLFLENYERTLDMETNREGGEGVKK